MHLFEFSQLNSAVGEANDVRLASGLRIMAISQDRDIRAFHPEQDGLT
jgi:hypothetical protein